MSKWSASAAIPERSVCAQIFDANGINVVALGATDDDTAIVEQIVDAHNAISERLDQEAVALAAAMRDRCARRVWDNLGSDRENELRQFLADQITSLPIPERHPAMKIADANVERLEEPIRTLLDAAGIAMDGWKDSTTEFGRHPLLTRLYIALLAACDDDPDAYQRIEAAYHAVVDKP